MRRIVVVFVLGLAVLVPSAAAASAFDRTLDGSGNNPLHPDWGQAGTPYLRVAPPNYADGIAQMVAGPSPRYVSNRVFNDLGQNIFSENNTSQWGWVWGQFIDHDIGLRDEAPAEHVPMPFDATDPLEQFQNDFGVLDFFRTPAAPGTGIVTPRQEINTLSSYIDASQVYGVANSRLDWLRVGSVDGDPTNNSASLLLPDNYLPRADARGDASTAPPMDLMGPLVGTPDKAIVAGDVRANENLALTGVQTLFAREHNRIVSQLPFFMPEEQKFQIARRLVGAEIQYITYSEFLPTLGVQLAPYTGYNPNVNASLENEFATVAFRAHSMVHGEFDVSVPSGTYTSAQLDLFRSEGIIVADAGGQTDLTIPLTVAFGNPQLVEDVGLGPVLQSLAHEHQYRNDEQIDNSMRSVLFQVPKPGIPDPSVCGAPVIDPHCFVGVADLGADDVQRGRDHGMPYYNELRRAYGLAPKTSFTAITGESTASFPAGLGVDDPRSMDFVQLRDANGNVIPLGDQDHAVVGIRRTTLAARLRAIYGTVDKVDAFVGMVSEKHVRGTEFGELQLAIWKKQFETLRDGDRFFYLNDPQLTTIKTLYGIDYRHSLAEIIKLNTGATVQANAFEAP